MTDLAAVDEFARRTGFSGVVRVDREGEDQLEAADDHVMPVPVHRLATTEDYLQVLDGRPQVSPPGERFAYNNGGFVVLALIAERAAGVPFPDLVDELVCRPAGLTTTGFPRSDALPPGAATGYLAATGLRTNVLHLPVRGSGDGGAYTTAADVHRLGDAVTSGRVIPPELVAAMTAPRDADPSNGRRHGLGMWLDGTDDDVLVLSGSDAGVSFRSAHDRRRGRTWTVLSNTSDGAWPLARLLSAARA